MKFCDYFEKNQLNRVLAGKTLGGNAAIACMSWVVTWHAICVVSWAEIAFYLSNYFFVLISYFFL
jgi:hypothetical protein